MTLNSYISSLIAKVHSFHLLNLKFIFIGMKHIAAVTGGPAVTIAEDNGKCILFKSLSQSLRSRVLRAPGLR